MTPSNEQRESPADILFMEMITAATGARFIDVTPTAESCVREMMREEIDRDHARRFDPDPVQQERAYARIRADRLSQSQTSPEPQGQSDA